MLSIKRMLAIGLVGLVLPPTSAQAYVDFGSDPDDRAVSESDPDIASSSRRVWRHNGRIFLRVGFGAYEELQGFWTVRARLDVSGDGGPDASLFLAAIGDGRKFCVANLRGTHEDFNGTIRKHDHHAFCRIRIDNLFTVVSKRIRWRLVSLSHSEGETERAPDTGFFS